MSVIRRRKYGRKWNGKKRRNDWNAVLREARYLYDAAKAQLI